MSLENRYSSKLHFFPLALPWILIIGGFVFTLLQSFNYLNPIGGDPSGESYQKVLSSRTFWRSLGFTSYIALVTAGISTIAGFFISYLFFRIPHKWQRLTVVYKIFLILPHISVAYLVLLLLSQTGIISSIFYHAGIIDDYMDFPVLIFDNQGIGIIVGYILKEIPFSILMISALMKTIPNDYLTTAEMLGASRWRIIRLLIIPHTMPAILSSFFILYLYTFGAFEMPFILGGSKPTMLSIAVYDLLFRKDFIHRPEAMAMLTIMLLVNILIIFLFMLMQKLLHTKRAHL